MIALRLLILGSVTLCELCLKVLQRALANSAVERGQLITVQHAVLTPVRLVKKHLELVLRQVHAISGQDGRKLIEVDLPAVVRVKVPECSEKLSPPAFAVQLGPSLGCCLHHQQLQRT